MLKPDGVRVIHVIAGLYLEDDISLCGRQWLR